MPNADDQLTERFRAAETQLEVEGLFEGIERRRARREVARRVQTSLLALAVIAATVAGFVALRSAFRPSPRATANTPSLVPPNGLIVFSRVGDDGRSHLFTARPDGTGVEQLTHGATNDIDSAISPDGQWITVVQWEGESSTHVGTVPFDDPDAALVEPQFSSLMSPEPAWSADGRMIAVREGNAQEPFGTALLIVPLDGESSVAHLAGRDADLAHPSWSPDSRIGFALLGAPNERETGWDLATVSVDGTGFRLLVTDPGDQTTPTWSPDGSRIAYLQPSDGGHEIWTISLDGTHKALIARAVEASLEPELAWAPDGSALLVSDGEWIYRVDATPEGDPAGNFVQLVRGVSPAWQPIPVTAQSSATVQPSPSPSPSPTPSVEALGHDIGLPFRLCHLQPLGGLDFLGDGTNGKAWTGTKLSANGSCSDRDRYGVAVDYTGDGVADSWSGETIEYCGGCEPWKAMDLNGDGRKELLVIVDYFSIMHYGVYTLLDENGRLEIEPFRIGEPGNPEHDLHPGKPFTFWVGGDAGISDWFYCETLPEFWLTGIVSPVEPPPGATKTVNRTHVSLMTDGIAHILFADTYTVPGDTDLQLPHTSPFFMDPDCGIGVRPG